MAASAFADSKPHYAILDGLRGVAALVVIWYHVFEGFATSPLDQKFNHGYLAVDFFFILSGFVVGYAYDDRWKGRSGNASGVRGGMRIRDFLKRRLVRLHPMVVLGSVLGAVTFLIQGSVQWDGAHVPFGAVMIAMLLGMFLIPAYPGAPYEVRGNNEMYPLNGPSWSLFFEYIGNQTVHPLVSRGCRGLRPGPGGLCGGRPFRLRPSRGGLVIDGSEPSGRLSQADVLVRSRAADVPRLPAVEGARGVLDLLGGCHPPAGGLRYLYLPSVGLHRSVGTPCRPCLRTHL